MSTDPMVTDPGHYTSHPIFSDEQWSYSRTLENGAEYSAFRYFFRYKSKANPIQDVEKGIWYLQQIVDNPDDLQPVRDRLSREAHPVFTPARLEAYYRLLHDTRTWRYQQAPESDQLAADICVDILQGLAPSEALASAQHLLGILQAKGPTPVMPTKQVRRAWLDREIRDDEIQPVYATGYAPMGYVGPDDPESWAEDIDHMIAKQDTMLAHNMRAADAEMKRHIHMPEMLDGTKIRGVAVVGGTSSDDISRAVNEAIESQDNINPHMMPHLMLSTGRVDHVPGSNSVTIGDVKVAYQGPSMFHVVGSRIGHGYRTRAAIHHLVATLQRVEMAPRVGTRIRVDVIPHRRPKKNPPQVSVDVVTQPPVGTHVDPFHDIEVAGWAVQEAVRQDWQANPKTYPDVPGEYRLEIIK